MAGKERTEGPPVNNLVELRQRLVDRQAVFFTRFKDIGGRHQPNAGWERIRREENSGLIVKQPTQVFAGFLGSADRKFTTKGYCPVIASILYDAITDSVGENIQLSLGNIETDMNRENWGKPGYTLSSTKKNHTILRAKDTITGQAIFIDGSYGQVDHVFRDIIMTFPEAHLSKYYRTAAGTAPVFEEVPARRIQRMFEASYRLLDFTADEVGDLTGLLKF